MRTPKASLKMIAEEAGTSISTVSGVLNGNGAFSDARRKQIWDIATRLNYKQNNAARALRQGSCEKSHGRAKTSIVMHISHSPGKAALANFNPFENYRCQLLSAEAQGRGLNLFHFWYDNVAFSCQPLINGLVDGAIVGTPHLQLIETLKSYDIETVLLDVAFSLDLAEEAMVNFDLRYGMGLLLGRLKELGHRRIAVMRLVNDPSPTDYIGIRWLKLLEANASAKMEIDEELSVLRVAPIGKHQPDVREMAKAAAPKIKSGEISAIMCLSDLFAGELISALKEEGLSTPKDVSVTGFTRDWPSDSNVASAENDWATASKEAVALLKEKIRHPETPNREVLVKPFLFEGSTLAAPSGKALARR